MDESDLQIYAANVKKGFFRSKVI